MTSLPRSTSPGAGSAVRQEDLPVDGTQRDNSGRIARHRRRTSTGNRGRRCSGYPRDPRCSTRSSRSASPSGRCSPPMIARLALNGLGGPMTGLVTKSWNSRSSVSCSPPRSVLRRGTGSPAGQNSSRDPPSRAPRSRRKDRPSDRAVPRPVVERIRRSLSPCSSKIDISSSRHCSVGLPTISVRTNLTPARGCRRHS